MNSKFKVVAERPTIQDLPNEVLAKICELDCESEYGRITTFLSAFNLEKALGKRFGEVVSYLGKDYHLYRNLYKDVGEKFPLNIIQQISRRRGEKNLVWFIAGGYAAAANGRCSTYGDIDIFIVSERAYVSDEWVMDSFGYSRTPMLNFYDKQVYNHSNTIFQFIFCYTVKALTSQTTTPRNQNEVINRAVTEIMTGFDFHICQIAMVSSGPPIEIQSCQNDVLQEIAHRRDRVKNFRLGLLASGYSVTDFHFDSFYLDMKIDYEKLEQRYSKYLSRISLSTDTTETSLWKGV